jgi:hypothetical protein
MPLTAMTHSPEAVLAKLLVDLGGGTDAGAEPLGEWPVYHGHLSGTAPDETVTVFGTAGIDQGRVHPTGERQGRWGLQVSVRAVKHDRGWRKATDLARLLDGVRLRAVDLDYLMPAGHASATYLVWAVETRPVISAGKDPAGRLRLFTVNCTAVVRRTALAAS